MTEMMVISLFMKESKRGLRGGDFGGRGELRSRRGVARLQMVFLAKMKSVSFFVSAYLMALYFLDLGFGKLKRVLLSETKATQRYKGLCEKLEKLTWSELVRRYDSGEVSMQVMLKNAKVLNVLVFCLVLK
ncbi:unnamed protein product [Vicia faba]|uniref:Uncharacterized protein n=1 Tax=Vicia faba TaxID=3906 RepID=A0AAV0YLH2_VICFA|nr:unnamed protein product [Vicia faba]